LAKMERFIEGIDERYQKTLHWALRHRRTVIVTTIGAFVLSCFSLRFIGKDFFPDTDESQFSATIKTPVGMRVEETEKVVKKVEATIAEAVGVDLVQSIVSSVGIPQGRSGIFSQNTGPHAATVSVNLVQPDQRKLTDVQRSREENYPELDVDVDREKACKLGFTQTEIANTILTSMSGDQNTPSQYTDPTTGNEYFIIVRLDDRWRSHVRDLDEVFLPAKAGGQPVALSTFARIQRSSGPVQIDRKYQERVVHVYANVLGRDLGGVIDDIGKALAKIPLPQGFKFNLSG